MAAIVYVSEVLCFMFNKFGKVPAKNIKDAMFSFYEHEEVVTAKELLHRELMNQKIDGLPRFTRRHGDNRTQREIDDLMQFLTKADEAQLIASLPLFTAADLERIPRLKPEEMDLCMQMRKLTNVVETVRKHDEMLCRVLETVAEISRATKGSEQRNSIDHDDQSFSRATNERDQRNSTSPDVQPSSQTTAETDSQHTETWADVATAHAGGTEWAVVVNQMKKPPRPRLPIRVRAAYVGRLHQDTTEEALTNYLLGLKGVVCKKLKTNDGKTYKTSAFYVTCCTESADLFYNENCWPDGVELRDWIYK